MEQGTLFIFSAPSGGGKTSLVNALVKKLSHLQISISHTTRSPRSGEGHGKNYFFVDEKTFSNYQQQGMFLEYAKVFNHWYGTSKEWVIDQLKAGIDVILEIDWQGARLIKAQMPAVGIFIIPPSREVLQERLQARKQDSIEIIATRMAQASQEISHYGEYEYLVVNDVFDQALADLEALIKAERLKTQRQQQRYQEVLKTLIK
ncbi:MAG: guanylate kinase [Candidatus Berkiellales bacterium]